MNLNCNRDPLTCRCWYHQGHVDEPPMTEQQTADTDNVLLEKLVSKGAIVVSIFGDWPDMLRNPDGPEAAERIKSLLAEADELRVQLAQTIMRQDEEWQEAKADRQRLQAEVERMRPWYLFYAEGKNLGEVAEACGGTIYNYSPWLTAPLVRAAIRSSEKDVK